MPDLGGKRPDERAAALHVLREAEARLPPGHTIDVDGLCRRQPGLARAIRALWAELQADDATMEAVDATPAEATPVDRTATAVGPPPDDGTLDAAPPADATLSAPGSDVTGTLPIGVVDGTLDATGGAPSSASASAPSVRLVDQLRAYTPASTRYWIQGEVGRGGMGAVLEVWDDALRRTLAMKVMLGPGGTGSVSTPSGDPAALTRFLEEAQVTGQLDHPGIVPVHELGIDASGRVYFTMPLVKGRNLRQIYDRVFAEEEGWSRTRALGVILKVCEAMAYAHSLRVVHRDLKPANVMVGRFGEVYVMDWGLARVVGDRAPDPSSAPRAGGDRDEETVRLKTLREEVESSAEPLLTMDGDIVGTPAYMPLEQARGDLDRIGPQTDVYAIGAMLYHLLTRRMPYAPAEGRRGQREIHALLLAGPPPVHPGDRPGRASGARGHLREGHGPGAGGSLRRRLRAR